jgi:hypothetical protein
VLKPKEIRTNGTITSPVGRYDKCGADFSEQEYKGAEVVNQIDRKTVQQNKYLINLLFIFLILD